MENRFLILRQSDRGLDMLNSLAIGAKINEGPEIGGETNHSRFIFAEQRPRTDLNDPLLARNQQFLDLLSDPPIFGLDGAFKHGYRLSRFI